MGLDDRRQLFRVLSELSRRWSRLDGNGEHAASSRIPLVLRCLQMRLRRLAVRLCRFIPRRVGGSSRRMSGSLATSAVPRCTSRPNAQRIAVVTRPPRPPATYTARVQ
jgi:hypothetical protein